MLRRGIWLVGTLWHLQVLQMAQEQAWHGAATHGALLGALRALRAPRQEDLDASLLREMGDQHFPRSFPEL